MITTVHVKQLRGRIDFAILTIREDEFEAVLKRFSPRNPVIHGRQLYEYCRHKRLDGRTTTVAVVRAFDQGHNVAQSVARDTIDDLAPRWLVLVGIAGGIPDTEFSLGDVLLASSLHDFSITAAIESQQPQLRPAGGPSDPAVERLLACLPAWRERLGNWNQESALGLQKPRVVVSDDIGAACYYGGDSTREKVRNSLQRHFPASGILRGPLYKIGAVATANVLLKDTALLQEWQRSARQITHVEMEAGGVYMAARHAQPPIPLLCVRGISDIVGLGRLPEWTQFACDSAASFLHALISTLPLEAFFGPTHIPASVPQAPASTLANQVRYWVNVGIDTIGLLKSLCKDVVTSNAPPTPTLDDIIAAFGHSSSSLLSHIVKPQDRISRPEEELLRSFLANSEDKVLCVLGSPGSGKTSLLALAAKNAMDAGFVTLGIKADMLPTAGQSHLELD